PDERAMFSGKDRCANTRADPILSDRRRQSDGTHRHAGEPQAAATLHQALAARRATPGCLADRAALVSAFARPAAEQAARDPAVRRQLLVAVRARDRGEDAQLPRA